MPSLQRIQQGGAIAFLAGVLGLVVAPLMNAAYHLTESGGTLPRAVWEAPLVGLARPFFTFAPPDAVYATYGKMCFLIFLGLLIGVLALRRYFHVRQTTTQAGTLQRWGFTLAVVGLALNLLGNISDYWIGDGTTTLELAVFIGGTLVGLLLTAVGLLLVGIAALRLHLLPRIAAWLLILWLPMSFVLLLTGLNNLLTSPLFALGITWIAVGYILWSRTGSDVPLGATPTPN